MNTLSQRITPKFLFKFTFPTIAMMCFISIYTMVDGIFVSNYVGTDALASVNIVFPLYSASLAVAIMFATGASALSGSFMGQQNSLEAKKVFTQIVIVAFVIGCVIAAIFLLFMDKLVVLLGADEHLLVNAVDYGNILSFGIPLAMLQLAYQYFFVTAGKPVFGFCLTFMGGATNALLDWLLIGKFSLGVKGAAIATVAGISIPAIVGTVYFLVKRKGSLCFVKTNFSAKYITKVCTNGSSEMVINIAIAITTMMFNKIMMNLAGKDGVAAITIILYSQFLLSAIFLGYSSGIAPLVSYNYGAQDHNQLKKIFVASTKFIVITSVFIFVASILLAGPIVSIFSKKGTEVYSLATYGFKLFAIGYLFVGINIFTSAMFTALNNGILSAIVSFLRSFVFLIIALLLMPELFGLTGVWLALPVAEFLCVIIAIVLLITQRKRYQY